MISVILYGRNDGHGYNLHRRAALSLNCIAEVLSDPSDEILFVDYNTSPTFPTFIEAISDTLTDKANSLLKIIRVPPSVHEQFEKETRLPVNEPLARNIAIRHSNPENRWILSTNTDMIFVLPKGHHSLSEIARDLPNGFYETPRFELPESLWECIDRKDAKTGIQKIAEWGNVLDLKLVVSRDEYILFDGPGDFQLMLRDQLFEISGFDESMLKGWHLDSNIAKRLNLLNGETKSLEDLVHGYHCLHTRAISKAHAHGAESNDLERYYYFLDSPFLPNQADSWGCPHGTLDDFSATKSPTLAYQKVVSSEVKPVPEGIRREKRASDGYLSVVYPANHVLPYLGSILATHPSSTKVAYLGSNASVADFLETFLADFGMPSLIQSSSLSLPECDFDVIVFDFGFDENQSLLRRKLLSLYAKVLVDYAIKYPKARFVALNAKENIFEPLVSSCINCNSAPLGIGCLDGFVLDNINDKKLRSSRQQVFSAIDSQFNLELDPSYRYKLGSSISFLSNNNTAAPFLDSNWSASCPSGTWTLGNTASLSIPLEEVPKQDILLELVLKPFTRKIQPKQKISLLLNDTLIESWDFMHPKFLFRNKNYKRRLTTKLPSSLFSNHNLKLTFEISTPCQSKSFGACLYNIKTI